MQIKKTGFYLFVICMVASQLAMAQLKSATKWTGDGNGFYQSKGGEILKVDIKTGAETVLITKVQLTHAAGKSINPASFSFSNKNSKLLVFTNTAKVWRYNTRGDYWVMDIAANKLTQLGKDRPSQSLMFAKFSPDGKNAAYVSEHNLFVEDLATGNVKQLTQDGTRKLINGTFDWAYEEEFFCRDGFRWSHDSKQIAYWQIDAKTTKD